MINTSTTYETIFEQKMKELDELYQDFHRRRIDKDSVEAKEKLKKAGCEVRTIMEEIEKNKEAKGVKILK